MNLPESEYHAYPAWSYSLIARYAREGFSSVATIHEPSKPNAAMEFGSLVDTMITKGKKAFESEYVVMDLSVPDAEKKALDYIWSNENGSNARLDEIPEADIMRYCNECGYQSKWGYDARMRHLLPYSGYYDILRTGKKMISKTDFQSAVDIIKAMRSNEVTKDIFGKTNDDVEFIYQSQFLRKMKLNDGTEVDVKIMPDLLIVDHQFMTVRPVDLKTSGEPSYNFWDNFIRMRYDIQASLYSEVLLDIISNDEEYKDYTLLPYYFVDISRTDNVPLVYEYEPLAENQADGLSYTRYGKEYKHKGWRKLLKEIIDYEQSDAVVPSYVSTSTVNDLLSIINAQ